MSGEEEDAFFNTGDKLLALAQMWIKCCVRWLALWLMYTEAFIPSLPHNHFVCGKRLKSTRDSFWLTYTSSEAEWMFSCLSILTISLQTSLYERMRHTKVRTERENSIEDEALFCLQEWISREQLTFRVIVTWCFTNKYPYLDQKLHLFLKSVDGLFLTWANAGTRSGHQSHWFGVIFAKGTEKKSSTKDGLAMSLKCVMLLV